MLKKHQKKFGLKYCFLLDDILSLFFVKKCWNFNDSFEFYDEDFSVGNF